MDRILYITATLPALTVTFIYNEIFRLRHGGLKIDTVSMNTPDDKSISSEARELRNSTLYLDQAGLTPKLVSFFLALLTKPVRTLRCCWWVISARPAKFPRDYFRLAYHLIESTFLLRRLKSDMPDHIHCHFINGPTSLGMFLAELAGLPYSFTMHASMIWLDPIAFQRKLESCKFCVSISDFNKNYVIKTYGQKYSDKIHIIHCGIDPDTNLRTSSGGTLGSSLRIVSVGQLNKRKGFHILIPALARLKSNGFAFDCTIVGGGAERESLQNLISELHLDDNVNLVGALHHEDVRRELKAADIFVLPCVVSDDGWRDGIPVALMEAMFCQLPVVSTNILGLPELIETNVSGLLVPEKDPDSLADAIQRLAENPEMRREYGRGGRQKVIAEFNNEKSVAQLRKLFECA